MKDLRRLLGDRLSGGITAALAGYFLLLQAFVAAFTCGMTVPVGVGEPAFILCQASLFAADTASDEAGDPDEPRGLTRECPCIIGHGAEFDAITALAPGADLGPAFAALSARIDFFAESNDLPAVDPSRLGLSPDPRGPPVSA